MAKQAKVVIEGRSASVPEAIRAVAGLCDGAHSRDGVGFNGRDTAFGNSLAALCDEDWTPNRLRTGYKVLKTYKKQLLTLHGIDFAKIADPCLPVYGPPVPQPYRPKTVAGRQAMIVDGGRLAFRFPYDPALNATLKGDVPGLRFEGGAGQKFWYVTLRTVLDARAAAQAVVDNGFAATDATLQTLGQIIRDAQ